MPRLPAVLRLAIALFSVAASTTAAADPPREAIVTRARLEVSRKVAYDPAWVAIPYPNGDVAPDRGVCTDVVVRSYRAVGVDFQRLVHEDIVAHPASYPTVSKPDRSIDHRRVGPMLAYLERHASARTKAFGDPSAWEPGDIVVWSFGTCPRCSPSHVGIVSDRKGPRGLPLVLHNLGPEPSEDDALDRWTVLGHFRMAK